MTIPLSRATDALITLLHLNGYRITGRCIAGNPYLLAKKEPSWK